MPGKIDAVINLVLRKLLQANNRRKLKKKYPRFCIIPGDSIGDEIIIRGLYEEDILVPLFDRVLKKYHQSFRESVALDVGANIGNHSLFFSGYFFRVAAFEPNDTATGIFRVNMRLNHVDNIDLFEAGLGNESKDEMFIENQENIGGSYFIDNEPENVKNQELRERSAKSFPVLKGDDILKTKYPTKIALMKLDCEGYELRALQGLENTIRKDKPIILFETHRSEGETGSRKIFSFLEENGYRFFYHYEPRISGLKAGLGEILGSIPELTRIRIPEDRKYELLIASSHEL
jgi:FkbM family methyltransferase